MILMYTLQNMTPLLLSLGVLKDWWTRAARLLHVFINALSVFFRPSCTCWWRIRGFSLRRRWFGKVCIMSTEMETSATQSSIWGHPLTRKLCTVVSRTRSIRSGLVISQECSVSFSHKRCVWQLFLRVTSVKEHLHGSSIKAHGVVNGI